MPCPELTTLEAFVAGKLEPEQRSELELHMDRCAACRKVVAVVVNSADANVVSGQSETLPMETALTAASSGLTPGDRIDHFEILGLLGKGGMGRVYMAQDTKLHRSVALKVLAVKGADRIKRLLQEARTTARFNHPNIVTIYQVGEHDGQPYLALEHLEGQTLDQRARQQPMPTEEVLCVGLAVARALEEAHGSQVLHRDLKPANVMLVGERICVLDFGLARSIDPPVVDGAEGRRASDMRLTKESAIFGTPAYMAPEQWRDGETTGATDIWSLGVMLYELITGRRPFDGASIHEQARLVAGPTPVPELEQDDKGDKIPDGLTLLVSRCVDKEAERRPTASEAVERLEALLQRWRGARRRRARLIGIVTLLFLLAVGSLAVTLVVSQQKREADGLRNTAETRGHEAQQQRAEALREGARRALADGDLLEARARLRTALEIEDSAAARVLWWRLTDNPLLWTGKMAATVNSVAHGPRGRLAVAAGNTVHLLDPKTGTQRQVLRGPRDQVMALAFSPDGERLVTGTWDGRIDLWTLADGSRHALGSGKKTTAIYSVRFSPDGKLVAAGARDGAVRLWQARSAALLGRLDCGGSVLDIRFSPDGQLLAAANKDGRVQLWEVATRKLARVLANHKAAVMGVEFSPNGRLLVTGGMDHSVRLWDVDTGRAVRSLGDGVHGITSISVYKKRLAAGDSDGKVRIWNLDALSGPPMVLSGHSGTVWELSFSPDGRWLASGGVDRTVRLWRVDAIKNQRPHTAHARGAVLGVSFSPDGKTLATGGRDRMLRIWDVATGALRRVISGHTAGVRGVAFSPDGLTLASGSRDRSLRLWELATGRQVRTLLGHTDAVWDVDFSPDGKLLASGSADKTARLWEVGTGRSLHVLKGHEGGVCGPRFSRDGRLLVTGSYDRTVRIWSSASGRALNTLTGHEATVYGTAFTRDNKVVTSSSDGTLRLWDLRTNRGKIVGRLPARAYHLDLHPDGDLIGVAGSDSTAVIWSLKTGQQKLLLQGHRKEVRFFSFSPDGKLAATTSSDGTVRLWDVRTGRPVWWAPLLSPSGVLLTHRGPVALGSKGVGSKTQWRSAVIDRARLAAVAPGGTACLVTFSGVLERWDTRADHRSWRHQLDLSPTPARPTGRQSTGEVGAVRALATGACMVLGSGEVRVFKPSGDPGTTIRSEASAIEADGTGPLTAVGRQLLFPARGSSSGVVQTSGGVTAMTWIDPTRLAVGYRHGGIELIPSTGRGPRITLEDTPACRVERLVATPGGTVAAGFDCGLLGLWSAKSGRKLHQDHLHGPVVHLALRGGKLLAATELASHRVWDLRMLQIDRCDLLRRVWRDVPAVWEKGKPVLKPPPVETLCR